MSTNHPEDLEYNDGLGDLLREKEKKEFSWLKTIVVMVVLIGLVFLGLILTFMIGKSLLDKHSSNQIPDSVMKNLEKMEKDMETNFEPKEASANLVASTANKTVVPVAKKAEPVKKEPAPKPAAKIEPKPPVKEKPVQPVKKQAEPKPSVKAEKPVAAPAPKVQKEAVKPVKKAEPAPKPAVKTDVKPLKEKAVKEKPAAAVKKEQPVKKETVSKPVAKAPADVNGTPFKVLLGKFSTENEARNLQKRLKAQNIDAYVWFSSQDAAFMVQIGAFKNSIEAEHAVNKFRQKGYNPSILQK